MAPPRPDPLTCLHRQRGLCPACQQDCEEDYWAWLEYGQHAQGERNWQSLRAELLAGNQPCEGAPPSVSDIIPF